jgi:integrase
VAEEAFMSARTTWQAKVDAYVAERRRAGFKLSIAATQLAGFARFAQSNAPRGPLTLELASQWALASRRGARITAARRIEVLRGFAQFCRQFDSRTHIPPRQLFGPAHRRLVPHIYTDSEICALLDAAAELSPRGGLRPASCATLLGLIAATGLRISEATALVRADVNLKQGVLLVRQAKFGRDRWVPLHSSTARALREYAKRRDREPCSRASDAFFIDDRGRALAADNVRYAFGRIRRALRWQARGGHPAPRIHDLRHRFICRRLQRWYSEGKDVDQHILALSTYVGHVKVTDTYWYVTATPELMAAAVRRSQRRAIGGAR